MAKSVRGRLPELLAGVRRVTPATFADLVRITGKTPAYVRRLLREGDYVLDPVVEGVRQDSLENLTRTLAALSEAYRGEAKAVRGVVLEAKAHAKLQRLRFPEDPWRETVLLHINTWLENPGIYPVWSRIQKQNAAGA